MTVPGEHAADPVQDLAMRLLARFEPAPTQATRPAYGYANEVWIGQHVVVHVKRAVDGGLVREAAVLAMLPAQVGSARVLDQGATDELEWMITARLPGDNLAAVWPALGNNERIAAVVDLWRRLRAVHRADVSAARAIGATSTPFYALEESAARRLLDQLRGCGTIQPSLHDQLVDVLMRMFAALYGTPMALAHTDAGPHNAVWDGRRAIPVDFETAAVAPPDVDLEAVLRSLTPTAGSGPGPASALLDEAHDLLIRPGATARLRGYAVLRDLWKTRSWLGDARAGSLEDPEADLHDPATWEPVRRLRQYVDGTGWLAEHLR